MHWKNRTWLVRRLCEAVAVPGQAMAAPGLTRRDAETFANWAEAARDRGAVLFVGAGWTANAEAAPRRHNEQGQRRPSPMLWKDLAKRFRDALETDLGNHIPADPLWLAELYRQRYGSEALSRLVGEAVPDEDLQPGPQYEALRHVPWRTVLTTNYDTLLERTFQPHRRVCVCVDDTDLVRSAASGALELIHLHGVLQRPDTIILAYEDYRQYPQQHPGLLAKVRQLFLQHPVLFVGFGLTDPNFLQWAGWLADIVGEHKNPWVNLTIDPAPEIPHARYWSNRLEFVSIGAIERFRAVAPALLRILGEALGKDPFSQDVARWRIMAAADAAAVVAEVQNLLRTGKERGADGPSWSRFLEWLFNAAASRVLDIAEEKWREPSAAQEAQKELRIEIDMRPSSGREQDEQLVSVLRRTFGNQWEAWRNLLAKHCGDCWDFHRVDVRDDRRASNTSNTTIVPLRDHVSAAPAEAETGDPALDALRAGRMPSVPAAPQGAQDYRLVGYLSYQVNDLARAVNAYRRALEESRKRREPLRVEWLTLVSLKICLERVTLHGIIGDAEAVAEFKQREEEVEKLSEELAQLPRDEGREPLRDYEISTLHKLVDELVKDLDRHDVDRTQRYGRIYGDADAWLDARERLWVAPPLVNRAAEALGTFQWRYGEPAEAVRTLSRYGSPRLGKIVSATAQGIDVEQGHIAKMISVLLEPGRWPGEWLAKVEALLPLVPSCTGAELDVLGDFVVKAREEIMRHDEVSRGGQTVFTWMPRADVEKLEAARWMWLTPAGALQAVERWIETLGDIDERALQQSGAMRALDRLQWTRWAQEGLLDGSRLGRALVQLLETRLAAERSDMFDDLEIVVDRVALLHEQDIVSAAVDTPLGVAVERAVRKLPHGRQDTFAALLTKVRSGTDATTASVAAALEEASLEDAKSLRHALDVVGAAAACPDEFFQKLISVLQTLTSRAAENRDDKHRGWSAINDARLVSFVTTRLLVRREAGQVALIEVAEKILDVFPTAAEYLGAVPPHKLGDAGAKAATSVTTLLRAGADLGQFSVTAQRYAGLRGVLRMLLELGHGSPSTEMLLNVAAMTRLTDSSLAAYATWILCEWAIRVSGEHGTTNIASLLAGALRGAAADRRVLVRANALRGVRALNELQAEPANAAVLAASSGDQRIAVRRALDGSSDFEPGDD